MKNFTEGNPLKLIVQFSIPICIGNLFQLFYSLADTRIVGRYLGQEELAAVGSTNSLNSMIIGFLLGMTNGFAIIVARHFGAKQHEKMRKAIGATYIIGIIVALAFTFASVFYLDEILKFLNTPSNIRNIASDYFRIILLGMVISMMYNVCSSILRAVGDAITPLIFLIASTIGNIFLDLLFIDILGKRVESVAYATVLAQFIAFVACAIYMNIKYKDLRVGFKHLKISASMAKEMCSTGFSMGFMLSLINVGSVALQTCINQFGKDIIIAHTAARKITDVFMLPFGVFGTAMATYCGQNMGAGKYDRIRKGLKIVIGITWVWCLLVVIVSYTVVPVFIKMVTGSYNDRIVDTATLYLKVNTILYFVCTIICIMRNALQGVGDTSTPIISSSIELITKVLVAILLTPYLGYWAIIISEPVSWVLMVIPILIQMWRNPIFNTKRKVEEV